MNQISQFFTLYWIIYFPTCIAYNDLDGLSSVDEIMTIILIAYTWLKKGKGYVNNEPWKEFSQFLVILGFYVLYSVLMHVNVWGAVELEIVQQVRPYSVIYCTWILNPKFTPFQKKLMVLSMIITLFSWIIYHPESHLDEDAEFPVLGQLAICTGMSYYLFMGENTSNKRLALFFVLVGLIAPKFKFMGEVVCFVAVMFYMRKQLNVKSPKTIVFLSILLVVVLVVTWTRFDGYYVTGWNDENLARPKTYRTSFLILRDYFPFGPGMGTFATLGAWRYYSPLYYKYNLNTVWGLDEGGGFICDAFYPTIAQYGIVGVFLFCIFWKRRLATIVNIEDIKYYRVALMAFFCLAIEQTADSSYLSGKGMGYFMLLGLCMNANRNMQIQNTHSVQVEPSLETEGEGNQVLPENQEVYAKSFD